MELPTEELLGGGVRSLLPFLGVDPTQAREIVDRVSEMDAKKCVEFADDRVRKRREASGSLREMAERWIGPAFARLDATRRKRFEAA